MKKKGKGLFKFWTAVFVGNALGIYVAVSLYPASLVLGNDKLNSLTAALIASLLLTLLLSLVPPAMNLFRLKIKNDLVTGLLYALVNIVGLWLIARGANYTGFGIASVSVAVILGLVLDILQFGIWKWQFGAKKK